MIALRDLAAFIHLSLLIHLSDFGSHGCLRRGGAVPGARPAGPVRALVPRHMEAHRTILEPEGVSVTGGHARDAQEIRREMLSVRR